MQAERYPNLFGKLVVFYIWVPKDDLNKHVWLIITIANYFQVAAAYESFKTITIKTTARFTG